MDAKRGQVAVFLIIGILILFAAAAIFFLTAQFQKKELIVQQEEAPETMELRGRAVSYIENCIEGVAEPHIYLLGSRGGIIFPDDPDKILLTENGIVNYAYLNGVNQLSLEKMEEELNVAVENSLPLCIDDFSPFLSEGLQFETKESKADTKIGMEQVSITLKYPVKILRGEDVVRLDTFSVRLPFRVGTAVQEAEKVISQHQSSPLTGLATGISDDFSVTYLPFDRETFLYALVDTTTPRDAPFTFIFAVKDSELNSAPRLEYVPDVVIRKGTPFRYQLIAIDAEQDLITYLSSTGKVSVSEQGVVTGTFNELEVFYVTFTVKDSKGLEDSQEVRFVVEE